MLRNYTISSLKSLAELPNLDTAQFTLNSRIFPSRRKTVEMLKELSPYHHTNIIVHYDFIYIISRFAFLHDKLQDAILNECHDIISYANQNPLIKGLVMHTDFPIRRDCYKKGVNEDRIRETYQASIWNVDAVVEGAKDIDHVLENSIKLFYNKYMERWGNEEIKCKIYLENTTKVCGVQGTVEFLYALLNNNPELKKLFGLCWDFEHDYAVCGEYALKEAVEEMQNKGISMMVHLNTIPKEVQPGSCKDSHSFTTICDCVVNSKEDYLSWVDFLNAHNIPFVREVKEETMFKELALGL